MEYCAFSSSLARQSFTTHQRRQFAGRLSPKTVIPSKFRFNRCLIQLPETNIALVDACLYEHAAKLRLTPFPAISRPPACSHACVELGVPPEQIDHVIITHTHFDHY